MGSEQVRGFMQSNTFRQYHLVVAIIGVNVELNFAHPIPVKPRPLVLPGSFTEMETLSGSQKIMYIYCD